ncbi:MAG: DUF4097 family beta strand repeat-containing protein, partial [Acutalibacteraceae bacterium]
MKTSAVIRIVIWSLVAVILTGMLVAGIALKGTNVGLGDFSIGFSGNTYADAGSYSIGGGSITEPINAVTVNWVSGKIDISVYDGDTVEVSETAVDDEDYKLRYKVENGRLTVHSEKSGFSFGIISKPKKELTVKIPRVYAESLKELKINSTSAEIRIDGLTVSQSVEIDTVSGKVTAENLTAASLECDTVSGDIKASGAIESFDLDSTSGCAEIDTSVPLKKLETDTVSGDVTVTIPENCGFQAEFD